MGENSIINTSESRAKDWVTKEPSVLRDLSRVPKEGESDRANIAIGVDRRDIDVDRSLIIIPSENQEIREDFKSRRVERQEKVKVEKNDSNDLAIIESYESILIAEGRGRGETIEPTDRSERPCQKIEAKRDIFQIIIQEQVTEERRVKKSLRKNRGFASRTRGFLSSASSSCARLIHRIIVLFLSLLGAPLSPLSRQYSGVASRGPALYTGSFFALVSLLVLLHPSMAIPTVATLGYDSGASGVTGTASTTNLRLNEPNATLPRIISHSRINPVVIDEHHHHHRQPQHREEDEDQVRDDQVLNFESVATGTKVRGLRRNREYTSRQFTNEEQEDEVDDDDEEEEEEDDDDEEDEEEEEEEEEEEDAFPASLIPHTRESGHEMASRLPKAELDTIRRSIVEGLGLERIPDPSKANVSQTEYRRAHQEYLTRLQHSRDSGDARQRRLHTFHPAERATTKMDRKRRSVASELRGSERKEENRILYFPVAITEENSLVDHATLRLLLDVRDTSIEATDHAVSLYRLTSSNSREFIVRQVLSKSYMARGPRWIELDATKLANIWYDGSKDNDEICVELKFECLETRRKLGRNDKQPLVINPVLNIFTTSDKLSEDFGGFRRKRRANPEHLMSLHKGRRTECRGENKKCCRHEMSVIFKDLKGFEFIVQPKNFDAGYCKGRCPPRYNPAHHHAFLQSLIWKEDRRKAPRPCCAPSKLEELEILYFDENDPTKLKISSWKNMKVLECACS